MAVSEKSKTLITASSEHQALQADFERFLPVRWVFHCYLTKPEGQWNIHKWRRYLLSPEYPIGFTHLLADRDFLRNVDGFLRTFEVCELEDLPRFWAQCVEEYTSALAEQKDPLNA